MKNRNYLFIIFSFLFSCTSDTTISIEEVIKKEIHISFDNLSIQNNDFVKFKLNKSELLIVEFSKGEIRNGYFIISAKDYTVDSSPIIVKLSSNVEGEYFFKLAFLEFSSSLEAEFPNGNTIEFPRLIIRPKWKAYMPYILVFVVFFIVFVIWILLKRKQRNSFDSGYLQISYPKTGQIELEGKRKIDLVKYLNIEEDIFCKIYCEQDTKFEDDNEVAIKQLRIDIDLDMKFKVNELESNSESTYLNDKDSLSILNSKEEEIIRFTYNQY